MEVAYCGFPTLFEFLREVYPEFFVVKQVHKASSSSSLTKSRIQSQEIQKLVRLAIHPSVLKSVLNFYNFDRSKTYGCINYTLPYFEKG